MEEKIRRRGKRTGKRMFANRGTSRYYLLLEEVCGGAAQFDVLW
jgi:hypothetical protein